MGNCKMAMFGASGKVIFSCDDIRKNIDYMKADFRKSNGTDDILKSGLRDRAYTEYCEDIDNFLEQCKCNEMSLKCSRCSDEDHEGYFCRCEGRNIQLAKQLRQKGMSTLTKLKDNKGQV